MMYQASEIFGTSVMNVVECKVMLQVCRANGETIEQAAESISFIDACLHAKRVYLAAAHTVRYTDKGLIRRDSGWFDMLDALVTGAALGWEAVATKQTADVKDTTPITNQPELFKP